MYISNREKYEDTKSTGWTFTLVGGIGLIAVILMDIGVLPFQIADYMKIIFTVVMGGLFLIFLIIGIKSFLSLKQISQDADSQEEKSDEIVKWFHQEYADYIKNYKSEDMDMNNIDSLYFPRAEKISQLICLEYKNLSTDELDHLVERLYSEIFTEENI